MFVEGEFALRDSKEVKELVFALKRKLLLRQQVPGLPGLTLSCVTEEPTTFWSEDDLRTRSRVSY